MTRRYSIVLPPAWTQFSATAKADDIIQQIAPGDLSVAPQLRVQLRKELSRMAEGARIIGGTEVLLPAARRGRGVIPANIVVVRADDRAQIEYRSGRLPRGWESAETEEVDFDGLPVTRARQVGTLDAGREAMSEARIIRVDHFIPESAESPRELAMILRATIMTSVGGTEMTEDLIEIVESLCDAISHSFRWIDPVTVDA